MRKKPVKTLKYFLFRITPIVILLLVVFTPLKAQAGLLDTIKSIPHKLIAFFLSFFIMIANVIARITSDLLNFVISPSAIKWSYTNPKNNPIIDSGLYVTKGFVSLALVVILVFIALSIALRIKEYASKKTLINLIVIALLVNFAPIVCGLIVDASNVITYYFLDKVQEKTNSIVGGLNPISIVNNITNISDEEGFWASMFSVFAKGIVMIIVNIAVAFIFFGYAFVFLFRYIAIWVLVILSPLAFIAWILPITREKYWRMWWSQFINWSFIGVPGAFFLYLSLSIFNTLNTAFSAPGMMKGSINALEGVLPYIIVVVFLVIGFIFSINAMGSVSSQIAKGISGYKQGLGYAKKVIKPAQKAGGWAKRKALNTEIGSKIREKAEKLTTRRRLFENIGGTKGKVLRGLRDTIGAPFYYPGRYLVRKTGEVLSSGVIEGAQEKAQKTEKDLKGKRLLEKIKAFHNATSVEERVGILNAMIEAGEINDAMDEKKFGKSAITKDELIEITKKAKIWKGDKKVRSALPHLADQLVSDKELREATAKDPLINTKEKVIINKLKPKDYRNIQKEALKSEEVVDAMLLTATPDHIKNLVESYGREAAEAIENRIRSGAKVSERLAKAIEFGPLRGIIAVEINKDQIINREKENTPSMVDTNTTNKHFEEVRRKKRE